MLVQDPVYCCGPPCCTIALHNTQRKKLTADTAERANASQSPRKTAHAAIQSLLLLSNPAAQLASKRGQPRTFRLSDYFSSAQPKATEAPTSKQYVRDCCLPLNRSRRAMTHCCHLMLSTMFYFSAAPHPSSSVRRRPCHTECFCTKFTSSQLLLCCATNIQHWTRKKITAPFFPVPEQTSNT